MPSQNSYAIFSAQYLPSMGGVELFTQSMAKELVKEGHRVTVVTSAKEELPYREDEDGFQIVRLPSLQLMNGRLPIAVRNQIYRRIWRQLVKEPVDRVLINTRFYPHSLEGLRYAKEKKIPALVLEHGSGSLTLSNPLVDPMINIYEAGITSIGKSYKPHYAGVSIAACKWLEHFGITTHTVIHNAIDSSAFLKLNSGRNFRSELGIPEERFLAVFIGRLVPEKGLGIVLDASKQLPNVAFVIAGSGPQESEAKQAALEQDNVYFVGRLDRGDVSALLSQAQCAPMPTMYPEGLPTSLLEACVQQTIPVITFTAGVEDVLGKDGGDGELCEASTSSVVRAIEKLYVLPSDVLRNRAIKLQKCVEAQFTWANSVKQLEGAY